MTYTVLSVAPNPRSYDANGPKLGYVVRFAEHADTDVGWSQNPETPAPQVGQSVDGTIDWNAKVRPRFRREYQQKGGGTGGGGGSTYKPRDPKEIAAIQRQHSQEMALRFLAVNPAAFQAVEKASDALEQVVKPLVDWFQRDITAGVALAERDGATSSSYGKVKEPVQTGQSDVPPPAEGEFVSPEPSKAENEMWATTS